MRQLWSAIVGVALVLSATNAQADVVMLTAEAAGSYTTVGNAEFFSSATTLVANVNGFVSSSYVIFDVGTIGDNVVSLDFAGNSGDQAGRNDDVEIEFNAFIGSIADLTNGTLNISELENARDYGSFSAAGDLGDDTPFSLSLNTNAIEDINASGGLFVITATQPLATNTSGFIGDVTAAEFTLTVTTAVPEPSSFAALALASTVLMVRRRRRAI
ncbi:MAG: PEP-CTERM sorting domain-containing protein [Planctomycetota bacterium]